jgi:hypothetical protein
VTDRLSVAVSDEERDRSVVNGRPHTRSTPHAEQRAAEPRADFIREPSRARLPRAAWC